jgi:hypothetical protein
VRSCRPRHSVRPVVDKGLTVRPNHVAEPHPGCFAHAVQHAAGAKCVRAGRCKSCRHQVDADLRPWSTPAAATGLSISSDQGWRVRAAGAVT